VTSRRTRARVHRQWGRAAEKGCAYATRTPHGLHRVNKTRANGELTTGAETDVDEEDEDDDDDDDEDDDEEDAADDFSSSSAGNFRFRLAILNARVLRGSVRLCEQCVRRRAVGALWITRLNRMRDPPW